MGYGILPMPGNTITSPELQQIASACLQAGETREQYLADVQTTATARGLNVDDTEAWWTWDTVADREQLGTGSHNTFSINTMTLDPNTAKRYNRLTQKLLPNPAPNTTTGPDGMIWTYPSASNGEFCLNAAILWLE